MGLLFIDQKVGQDISSMCFALEATQFEKDELLQAQKIWDELCDYHHALLRAESTPIEKACAYWKNFFNNGDYGCQISTERGFTLTGTLLDQSGSCLGLTTLFVCLSQKLGLDFRPYLYENHIAVTLGQIFDSHSFYDEILGAASHRKMNFPVHIEMTLRGELLLARHRQHMFGEPVTFGPILNEEQFLAVHFSNRAAFVLTPCGYYDDALYLLDAALELYPEYVAAHINRAAIYCEIHNWEQMRVALEKAETFAPQWQYRRRIDDLRNQPQNPAN